MFKDLAISDALARELRRVPEEDRTIKARHALILSLILLVVYTSIRHCSIL